MLTSQATLTTNDLVARKSINMHEEHTVAGRTYYIVGVPGSYAVKACGNNRICGRFTTLEEARNWLTV